MTPTAESREVRLSPRSSARIRHVPSPAAQPSSSPTSSPETVHLDTDDAALARRGLTLSHPTGPHGDWLLTVPQDDGHWAVTVPRLPSAPGRAPAALTGLLETLTDGHRLKPLPAGVAPADGTQGASRGRSKGRKKQKKATGAHVLSAVLSAQVEALELWDLRVRLEVPDAVHQLRVTARSLRSLLGAARPYLEEEPAERLGTQLQELGRSLSTARDAEVIAELLPGRAAALEGLVGESTLEIVDGLARTHFDEAADAVRRSAARPELRRLLREAQAFAQRPPLTAKAAELSPQQMSDRLLRRALRRAAREARVALAQEDDLDAAQRLEHLHAVRKKVKRVRYVAKVLEAGGFEPSGPVRRLGQRAKETQDVLGALLDDSVAAGWLAAHRDEMLRRGADPYELGLLRGAQVQRVHGDLEDGFRVIRVIAGEFGGPAS